MIARAVFLLCIAAAAALAQTPVCTAVEGDQIFGSDLARAFPAFRAIPPDTRIAPAPLPGGLRIFSEPELATMGARFGLVIPTLSHAVCFRVNTTAVNRDAVLAAMKRSLAMAEVRIDLQEISTDPVPPGVIQFPVESLMRPASPDMPSLWRGEVVAGTRHFTIWAKARVSAPTTRLVAVADLKQGQMIDASQVRSELVEAFPTLTKAGAATGDKVTGMIPLRSIAAGSEIRLDNLVRPLDVARGDMVQVEVRLGKARLSLNCRAESAGRKGEMIAVRNPESSRVFRARVEGKDRVLVDPLGLGPQ
jgi:flagella basal body P-ring formation protein FlgA